METTAQHREMVGQVATAGLRKLTMEDFNSSEIQKTINYLVFKYGSGIKDRALTKDDLRSHLALTFCKLVTRGYVIHWKSIQKIMQLACITFVTGKEEYDSSLDGGSYTDDSGDEYNPYENLVTTSSKEYDLQDFTSILTSTEKEVVDILTGSVPLEDEELKNGVKAAIAQRLNTNRRGVRKHLASIRTKLQNYLECSI